MKPVLLFILLLPAATASAQTSVKVSPDLTLSTEGKISGKIIDGTTQQPIDYATITVKSLSDSAFVTGSLTAGGGKFIVDRLKPGEYEVVISFLGYESITRTVVIDGKSNNKDMGAISLAQSAKALGEVEITSEKQDLINIDRKVFDVEKNAITAGGSALDVLRQVPTLTVDIDGNISLRGSNNVTIFINGKNTGISGQNLAQVLKSMPASSIKNVELITNPSAKYDAAGMSGIINIITRKNIAQGSFGTLSAGIGTRNKYSLNGSWNYRKDKFSSSINVGSNSMTFQLNGFNHRDNFFENAPDFSINNERKGEVTNDGINLSGNLDYTPNANDNFSFNYMLGVGRGWVEEKNSYEFLDSNRTAYRRYDRFADNNFTSPSTDFGLSYTRNLSKSKRKNELVVSTGFSYFKFPDNQNYLQQELTLQGEGSSLPVSDYHNDVNNQSYVYNGQADYTLGIGESGKFEAGLKSNIRNIRDSFSSDSLDHAAGARVPNALLSNNFQYDEVINSAYINYAGSLKKWGYQAGLRTEQTILDILQLAVSPTPVHRSFANLFPSAFLNRKWEKSWETQVSYSRRINRPNSWFLNPFPDYSDPLNTRAGNPYLNPEFVNAYELSVSKYWTAHSLTITNYYRQIADVFQRIREIDQSGVSRVSFNNFGASKNMGSEFVLRNKISSFWTNTTNLNIFRTKLNGQTAIRDYATDAINWNIRIMSNFRFWKNADLQLSAFYMAPVRIPQGYYYGFSGVDVGFKKDVAGGKGSVGINVQDVFNTRKFRVTTSDFNYSGETQFKRESQWVMANFTWKFGNPGEGQPPRRARRNTSTQSSPDMNIGM